MEAWLLKELEERRNNRQIAALARATGISSPRLQKIAKAEAEPTAEELGILNKALAASSGASPTASDAPAAKPAPAPAPKNEAAAAAAASSAPAAKPAAPAAPAKAAPMMAPPTAEFAQMKLPEQGDLADFPYRQKLIEFARLVREWPDKHKFPKAGELAYLQVLWNHTQGAISAVNMRIWGKPEGPGVALEPKGRRRKPHHSLRFLFKQAAEEKLPRDVIDELTKIARGAVEQGAAAGFLDAFVKGAYALLDEEDFDNLVDAAAATAGPGAQVDALYAALEGDEEGEGGAAAEGESGESSDSAEGEDDDERPEAPSGDKT